MEPQNTDCKTIIEGITEDGRQFRPGDWAERMSGSLSTFRKRRIYYSPLLRPATRNGNKCVIMDDQVEALYPKLYKEIMDFAKTNKLRIERISDQHLDV